MQFTYTFIERTVLALLTDRMWPVPFLSLVTRSPAFVEMARSSRCRWLADREMMWLVQFVALSFQRSRQDPCLGTRSGPQHLGRCRAGRAAGAHVPPLARPLGLQQLRTTDCLALPRQLPAATQAPRFLKTSGLVDATVHAAVAAC